MKRLWNSSGFWMFIIAATVLTAVYKVTESEMITTLIGSLAGIDRLGKSGEDLLKAKNGIQFNPLTKQNEKI